MRRLFLLVVFTYFWNLLEAQPCAYRDSFKPSFTSGCATYNIGPYIGWAQFCTGAGYTGSGRYTVLKVCTDSLASCIQLNLSPGTYTGHAEITLFANCWSNSPSGYVSNSHKCIQNTSGIYSTEGLGLAPNTCYVAAIWTKDTGTFQVCHQLSARPADDTCLGATTVPFVSTYYNTSCYTHDTAANKEKNHSCVAGALKKSRWFKYTLTCDTFAKFYFSNMSCTGGSSGYNVTYYTGTCGSLNYLSCSSGTGGSFNTTISGLSIGTTIYVVVNGNHGSNCGFSLRADTPVIAKYSTQNIAICNGKSIRIGGISRTTAGTYKDTLWKPCGSAMIIDSVRTFNLTINPTYHGFLGGGICPGGRFFWKGRLQYNAGAYSDTFVTVKGCDSILTLVIHLRPHSYKTIDSQICQGKSVWFNGFWRTNSGTYLDTLRSSNRCDSFITLNLTVNPTTTTHIYDTICQGGSKFFNGINRTVSGSYSDTFSSYKNCDSFIILNLFVRPALSKIIDTSVCHGKSVLFKGQNRSTTGIYRDTLKTTSNCDSIIVLNLNVLPQITRTIDTAICLGKSVFFKGQNRTTTGVYRDTLVNALGCDSIVILNLTVKSTSTRFISRSICQPHHFIIRGKHFTTSGIYYDTLVNAVGCDSIVTYNLVIKPISNTTINLSICQGDSVFFKGQNRTTTGIYRDSLRNIETCDSFVVLNLTVNPVKTTNLNIGICAGNSYFFKGQNRSTTGIYRDTLKTTLNCDSIIVLNLTVLPLSTRTIDTSICFGKSVFFKGQNRTATGVYRDTLTNPFPTCDSIIILNLTVKNTSTTNLYDTICQGQSIVFKGVARTATGIYRDTLVNALGCDSFVLLNLIVKALPNVNAGLDTSRVNCTTDSVRLGTTSITGQSYSWTPNLGLSDSSIAQPWAKPLSTTSYIVEVVLNATGCKLKDTVTITVLPSTISASIRKYLRTCRGASGQTLGGTPTATMGTAPYSYLWTPNIYINSNTIANPLLANTQQGNYTYILQITDGKGCIVRDTAQVIVDSLPLNAAGRDTGLCRNSPFIAGKLAQSKMNYLWNPTTNLSSGTLANPSFNSSIAGFYQYVLTITDSSNTCLLRDTLSIQVHPEKYDTLRPNICLGQSFFFNGAPRTASGVYYQNAITSKGCDSFVVLYLTVNNVSTTTIDSQICQGKVVFFKGQNRTTTGTYRDTFLNAKNCDSIVTLNLTVNPTPTTNINLTICEGQSVNFNGLPRTTSGVYRDTLSTDKNCDSFIILQLTVSPKSFKTIDTSICKGKTYFFKGQNRSTNLTLKDTFVNAAGCDSIVTLLLTMKDTSSYTIRDTICRNSIRLFNGSPLNVTGIYRDTLVNAAGCDSFLYLQLFVKDTSSRQLFDTICSNAFKAFNGVNRTTTGVYRDTLVNAMGCDSFIYLNLWVKSTSSSTSNVSTCANQPYFFKGQNRTTSGTYHDTILNSKGCDSFITLNLTVNPLSYKTIDTAICRGQSYFFKGLNRTVSGTYRDTLNNAKGCDSIITLILAFKDTSRYTYTDTICKNHPIWFNGQWRDENGLYKDTLTNAKGCDSFIYLNLWVKNTSTTLLYDTICSNGSRYFKGQNLNVTGTYVDTLVNRAGCDSFVILHLVVHPITSSARTINVCQGQFYSFKGKNLTASGIYYDTLVNKLGCDSLITLTLVVNPLPIADAGTDQTRVNCDGDSVMLGAAPNPAYAYLWTPNTGIQSPTIANPYSKTTVKTTYILLVTNVVTGCQAHDTAVIDILQSQLGGSAIARNLTCFNDFSGQLKITATNGYSPYSYQVNSMGSYTSSNIISNLPALPSAIYTIKDAKGCLFSGAFVITQPDSISIKTILKSDLKCYNDSSGRIAVSVVGGIPPYRYAWSRSLSVDSLAEKLADGLHSVTVSDDSLCTKPHRIILTQPTKLVLLDTIKYPNPCYGDTLGKLRAIVGGGLAPYTYKWSNGRSESLIDKLVAGVYKLTIEDGNLCKDSFHTQLIDPSKLIIDSIVTQKLNCNDKGKIRLVASAGTKPYRYRILGGSTFKADSLFDVYKAGEYKIQVMDKNLCIAKDSVNIGYQTLIKIQMEPSERTIQLGEQVQLGFRVLEGDSSTIQSLRWSPGIGLSCSDCAAPYVNPYNSETYTLNIGYANECETGGRLKIVVESKDELFIPNAFNPYSDTLENKTFKIYSNNVLRANLAIYNRWGEEVFRSLEPHRIGWNGEYKGAMSTRGMYYYHLDITYLDGRRLRKNGNINLIY